MSPSVRYLLAIGATLVVEGCASPDSSDYAHAAAQHAHWAEEARQGASEDEAASRFLAAQGDQARANDLRENGAAFNRRSQLEQFQADTDQWLSRWWPSWSRQ
jgi:outer membrane murein-binding lipoprotein Lpp